MRKPPKRPTRKSSGVHKRKKHWGKSLATTPGAPDSVRVEVELPYTPRASAVLTGYRLATPEQLAARAAGELPPTVELCGRVVDNGFLCQGIIYRPQPGQAYDYKCGATLTHKDPAKRPRIVKYVRADILSEALKGTPRRWLTDALWERGVEL